MTVLPNELIHEIILLKSHPVAAMFRSYVHFTKNGRYIHCNTRIKFSFNDYDGLD